MLEVGIESRGKLVTDREGSGMDEDYQEPKNWVERKHRAEEILERSKSELWSDLCVAIADSCRSFNKLYSGKSAFSAINGHHFRITVPDKSIILDGEFDDDKCTISTTWKSGMHMGVVNFRLDSDHESAFILDDKAKRVTPEEASERILKVVFF
jgi:hypothetical protein